MKKQQNNPNDTELKRQVANNKIFNSRLKFSQEVFYPFMAKNTQNATDAKIFAESLAAVLNQQFQNMAQKVLVKDLHLEEEFAPNIPDAERKKYMELFTMFADQTVSFAVAQFGGLAKEIDTGKENMTADKKLEEIPVQWGAHRPETEDGINRQRAEHEKLQTLIEKQKAEQGSNP